jgi:hypothetical protein
MPRFPPANRKNSKFFQDFFQEKHLDFQEKSWRKHPRDEHFQRLSPHFPFAAPFFVACGRKPKIVNAARRSIFASTTDRLQRMRRESRNVQRMFL